MIWLFDLILFVLLLLFIESIGFWGSVGLMGIVNAVYAIFCNLPVADVIGYFIQGAIYGAVTYVAVKVFLFLLEIFGDILYFVLIIIVILAIIGFIL